MVVVAIAQDVLQDTEVARSIVIFGHGVIVTATRSMAYAPS